MKNITYSQLSDEVQDLIMEQGRWQHMACINGNPKEMMDRISDIQKQIDEKRMSLRELYKEIIERIETYYQQGTTEYNVLIGRFVYQMMWDEIAYFYCGENEELAKLALECVEWDSPELMKWMCEHTGVDEYEDFRT